MSVDSSSTTHIWTAENGETLRTMTGSPSVLNLSPNCKLVVSGDGSETFVLK